MLSFIKENLRILTICGKIQVLYVNVFELFYKYKKGELHYE